MAATIKIKHDSETNIDQVEIIMSHPYKEHMIIRTVIEVPNGQGRQWCHKNFPNIKYESQTIQDTEVTSVKEG